jgi:hypothetical protein
VHRSGTHRAGRAELDDGERRYVSLWLRGRRFHGWLVAGEPDGVWRKARECDLRPRPGPHRGSDGRRLGVSPTGGTAGPVVDGLSAVSARTSGLLLPADGAHRGRDGQCRDLQQARSSRVQRCTTEANGSSRGPCGGPAQVGERAVSSALLTCVVRSWVCPGVSISRRERGGLESLGGGRLPGVVCGRSRMERDARVGDRSITNEFGSLGVAAARH